MANEDGPLRAYLDTSVFGGVFDEEFAAWTRPLFEAIFGGRVRAMLSDTLVAEIVEAPAPVRALLRDVMAVGERCPLSPEALELQQAYLAAGVIGARYADDALHVAQATLAGAHALVSWNFRHLVDPRRSRQYNRINVERDYPLVFIITPLDAIKLVEGDHEPDN